MEQQAAIKHLLIVSPSLKAGGIERALTVLANEFVKNGLQVSFIACLPGEAHYSLDPRVMLYRSRIPYAKKSDKLFFYLRLLRFLRRQVMHLEPEAILSFGDVFNPLVLLALYGTRYPVFISDRTSPDFRINPLARFLKRQLYPCAAGIIAQTPTAARAQRLRYGVAENITIIPNAIQLVEESAPVVKDLSILYVGRLSWEKGVDRLIKAFAQLTEASGWCLEILGEGPEYTNLKELVEELNLSKSVIFHGLVKDPTPWYRRASIFVLPSYIEGFPNAMCEAMSAGLPVVCFDSIPYDSIFIHQESGLAVEQDNIEALSSALCQLVNAPQQRIAMGIEAKKASQRFRRDIIACQYLQFIGMQNDFKE